MSIFPIRGRESNKTTMGVSELWQVLAKREKITLMGG